MQKPNWVLTSLAVGGSFLVANISSATPVTYNVVQAQSSLTITSKLTAVGGLVTQTATKAVASTDQGGSNVTTYTGTINADLVPGVSIQLNSAALAADLQTVGGVPINLAPASGGAGSAPGDYAFNTTGSITTGFFALRNVILSVSGSAAPLNGSGQFASNTFTDVATSGITDLGGSTSTIPLTGFPVLNSSPTLSSVTTVGNTETLKLSFRYFSNVLIDATNNVFSQTTFTGNIVATRVVPEPSSFALCGLAVAGLIPYGIRRHRRRSQIAA